MFIHISDEEKDRLHENCLNIVKRHCRIGKVSLKPPKHWGKLSLPKQPLIPWTPGMAAPWAGGYVPVTSSADIPFAPLGSAFSKVWDDNVSTLYTN